MMLRRALAISLMVMLTNGSVRAEVCDKIAGEAWRLEHGPVLLFGFGYLHSALLLSLLLVFALSGRAWPGYVIASLLLGLGVTGTLTPSSNDPVYRSAIAEGCWHESAPWYLIVAAMVFAVTYQVITFIVLRYKDKGLSL